MIDFLIVMLLLWCAVPLGVMAAYATYYGYSAKCTYTWHLGPGVPICIKFSPTHLYWCPLGMVGFEVEMD
jgi:hypothetical protein